MCSVRCWNLEDKDQLGNITKKKIETEIEIEIEKVYMKHTIVFVYETLHIFCQFFYAG